MERFQITLLAGIYLDQNKLEFKGRLSKERVETGQGNLS